jgi:hypothetical protein
MSTSDIALASAPAATVRHARAAVLVPLALAFIGLAVVAGVGAGRQGATLAANTPVGIDPVVTGSVVSADEQARAMKTLDR